MRFWVCESRDEGSVRVVQDWMGAREGGSVAGEMSVAEVYGEAALSALPPQRAILYGSGRRKWPHSLAGCEGRPGSCLSASKMRQEERRPALGRRPDLVGGPGRGADLRTNDVAGDDEFNPPV